MPRREGPHIPIESLSPEARAQIESGAQACWYGHVTHWIENLTVLDVGSGDGAALPRLRAAGASRVRGIDIAPASTTVHCARVEEYPARSWDVVLAMDVIEHVEDDRVFLDHLLRVARRNVFISTPNFNWRWAGLRNPHHVREYAADELAALLVGCDYDAWGLGFDRTMQRLDVLTGTHTWDVASFGIWIKHQKERWLWTG